MATAYLALHGLLALTSIVASVLGVLARMPARARAMASYLLASVTLQTFVGDLLLYPLYLRSAKPVLQTLAGGSRSAADVFEIKEHLAFFVLALTIGVYVVTRREPKPTVFVRVLFGCTHGAIILVATLGLVVASLRTP